MEIKCVEIPKWRDTMRIGKDSLVRIEKSVYEILRNYGLLYGKEIKQLTNEIIKKWEEEKISDSDKKLIQQMLSRGGGKKQI